VAPIRRRPDLNPDLDTIIMKLLAKDPQDRFSDHGALRRALRRAAGLPIVAPRSAAHIPTLTQHTPDAPESGGNPESHESPEPSVDLDSPGGLAAQESSSAPGPRAPRRTKGPGIPTSSRKSNDSTRRKGPRGQKVPGDATANRTLVSPATLVDDSTDFTVRVLTGLAALSALLLIVALAWTGSTPVGPRQVEEDLARTMQGSSGVPPEEGAQMSSVVPNSLDLIPDNSLPDSRAGKFPGNPSEDAFGKGLLRWRDIETLQTSIQSFTQRFPDLARRHQDFLNVVGRMVELGKEGRAFEIIEAHALAQSRRNQIPNELKSSRLFEAMTPVANQAALALTRRLQLLDITDEQRAPIEHFLDGVTARAVLHSNQTLRDYRQIREGMGSWSELAQMTFLLGAPGEDE